MTEIIEKPATLIGPKTVMKRIGISYTTLWRWVKEGRMPKPVKIGGSNRWKESDIENYIQQITS